MALCISRRAKKVLRKSGAANSKNLFAREEAEK